ncbi:MAG: hypothetical protein ACO3LT_08180 [Ilumatobacteraceae bacterium]
MTDAEHARRALVRAYHRFFETAEGQLVLADLEKTFRYALPALVPMEGGRIDPNQMLYADGQRSVVCYIHQIRAQMPLDDEEENPNQPKVKT